MSISPPTDIVLDVARAADPARASEAAARLNRAKPGDAAAFARLVNDTSATSAASPSLPPGGPAPAKLPANSAKAFQQFEAMTLATMIESAMPDDATSAYGSGTAGSVWKSMMAEQLGKQMAAAGGIGLASMLERKAVANLGGDMTGAEAGSQARSLIMTNLERGAAQAIRPAADDEPKVTSTSQDKA